MEKLDYDNAEEYIKQPATEAVTEFIYNTIIVIIGTKSVPTRCQPLTNLIYNASLYFSVEV